MFTLGSLTRLASLAPVRTLRSRAAAWAVQSQQTARRNALLANTHLTARRRDRDDVDDYFAEHDAGRDEGDAPLTRSDAGRS